VTKDKTKRKPYAWRGIPRREALERSRRRDLEIEAFLSDSENARRAVREVADRFGVTESVVGRVRSGMGLDGRFDRRREVMEFLLSPENAALTDTAVARRMGCRRETVTGARRALADRAADSAEGQVIDLPMADIRTDGGTTARARIDVAARDRYAEAMQAGAEFPPIVVFYDGAEYWLAHGIHRFRAAARLKRSTIAAEVRMGDRRDAAIFAAGCNVPREVLRSKADRRRAVEIMLNVADRDDWPARDVAKYCGVRLAFVTAVRRDLERAKAASGDGGGGRNGDA
jgi:uncharacterized ParB-like nuclease family protein